MNPSIGFIMPASPVSAKTQPPRESHVYQTETQLAVLAVQSFGRTPTHTLTTTNL